MLLLETRAEATNPRYSRVLMDARSVARAAGIKLNTLNAWVSRGLIPGVTVGTSGKRRDFDVPTATRIAIFAELQRHAPIEYAARSAAGLSDDMIRAGWLYVIPAQVPDRFTIVYFSPDERPSEIIRRFEESENPPRFYYGIYVAAIAEQVRQAEAEWQESRGAKS